MIKTSEFSPTTAYAAGRASYSDDYFHEKVRLGRFSSADLQSLMTVMREKGFVPQRDRIVFLDTETTGIQGGIEYVQRRTSTALTPVFTHNVHDVVSLAALTVHACDRVVLEPAELDDPLDLYSLSRVMENSADWRRSIRLYEMAIAGGLPEPTRRKALENLSVVYRRSGEPERSREICTELMGSPAAEGDPVRVATRKQNFESGRIQNLRSEIRNFELD